MADLRPQRRGAEGDAQTTSDGVATGEADRLHRLAAKLRLDVETVDQVFSFNGSELDITVSPRKLSSGMAAGTRELAQLVAAGRQGSEIEEWTSVDVIRDWCQRYRRYDGANFAGALKALDEEFQFRGTGAKREIRVSRPGWESVADLIRRMVNGVEA